MTRNWKVPYSGISNRLGLEEAEALVRVLQQDTLTSDRTVAEFEQAFARRIGARYAVATNSCTTALALAAQVLRLQEGDEVIATPQTFWGALFPFLSRRCRLRFADIDANSLNLDPATIEPLIGARTKAIYLVHHGGQAADMDPILDVARRYRLRVIEDCAHVPGGTYKDRHLGTIGDIGCFSFHSLKNMTTGEGGMFVTNDETLAGYARALSRLGTVGELRQRPDKRLGPYAEPAYHKIYPGTHYSRDYVDDQIEFGTNYRMSELQGALGLVQLAKLDRLNDGRRRIAARLNAGLAEVPGIELQQEKPYAHHIYHLYTLFYHPEIVGAPKDDFIRYLEEEGGIQVVIRYFPVHLSPELRAFGHEYGECPVAERVFFEHQIQLPIYNHLTDEQCDHMIETITRAVARLQRGAAVSPR